MIDALTIAASGLRAEQKQIDIISNNVANLQTPGFKKTRVSFSEMAGAPSADGTGFVAGGTQMSTAVQFSTGDMKATRNVYDLAIDGDGFFELQALDGSAVYTRDGQFHLDADGNLVSSQGLQLARSVQVPVGAKDINISSSGIVTASIPGDSERSDLGEIELTRFASPELLESRGGNLYAIGDQELVPNYGKPGEAGYGERRQGYVEMANGEMVDEMSTLVLAQRAYQLNARILQASDQILETINNLRR